MRPSTAIEPCFIASAKRRAGPLFGLPRGRGDRVEVRRSGDARRLLERRPARRRSPPRARREPRSRLRRGAASDRATARPSGRRAIQLRSSPAENAQRKTRTPSAGLGGDDRRQLLACRRRRAAPLQRSARAPPRGSRGELRLGAWSSSPSAGGTRSACSRRWGRRTTATRGCSRSARTAAGGASSSSASPQAPGDTVLDVATGTGTVAIELARRKGCRVVGPRPERGDARGGTRASPARGRARPRRRGSSAVRGRRRSTRSRSRTSSATSTTPRRRSPSWLASCRPGGTVAGLEFGAAGESPRPCRLGGVRRRRPAGSRDGSSPPAGPRSAASSATASGTSGRAWPLERLLGAWRDAGIEDVQSRSLTLRRRRRHLGPPLVSRASWYALRPGGWRDYVTLLHVPYTLWHLSYVVIGAALAPRVATRQARLDARRLRARARHRRARPRRAPRPAARDAHPGPRALAARRRLDRSARSRSGSRPRSRGGRGCSRSSPSAASSSSPTTSSCSAAPSTPTSGSPSPGARSRCSPPTPRLPRRSPASPSPRPCSRRC